MTSEISLQNSAILCLGPKTAPQASSSRTRAGASRACSSAIRHIVDVMTTSHRVREVHFPIIALVDIGESRRDSALGHDGMRLAQETL